MEAIQSLMNFIFFLVVAATIVGSIWLSRKYKERFAEFPWRKSVIIIAIEVFAWILFNWFWNWVQAHPWVAIIVVIVLIIVFLKKKRREEQIL